ncbi:hypothetical protein [Streptomyces dangxiongensis]|uniref:hypothetical protein n=1 Tax=Streptomyces dangxiongensis TaxID=1442032 RepID=UPI00196A015C|nr:hypothetical protein [Streptomyces dangxiongensis]
MHLSSPRPLFHHPGPYATACFVPAHSDGSGAEEPAPAGHGSPCVPVPGEGVAHGGWGGHRRTAARRPSTVTPRAGAAGGVARRARTR